MQSCKFKAANSKLTILIVKSNQKAVDQKVLF